MYPPNILITNYCNQNCPFCFARVEMKDQSYQKEMGLEDYKKIISKVSRAGLKEVKLLGGEPTLHSQFTSLLDYSFSKLQFVRIFTNGIISEQLSEKMSTYGDGLTLTANVMTPGFLHMEKIRRTVISRLLYLSDRLKTSLSFTIDPFTDMERVVNLIPDSLIKKIFSFRIGISNPTAGEKNNYQFSDFPRIGEQLIKLLESLKKRVKNPLLSLNCGFTRCMFTDKEYTTLLPYIKLSGWSCFGKTSDMDITTDRKAFHCFPLSQTYRCDESRYALSTISNKLILERLHYWNSIRVKACQRCPHFGLTKNKCPGPCIAFRINAKNDLKSCTNINVESYS